jgi:acyl dehydratase
MLDRSLVGRESEPVVVEVERGMIRRFAEALGDANPIYVDEAAAGARWWRRRASRRRWR